jgi:hypothetical protein
MICKTIILFFKVKIYFFCRIEQKKGFFIDLRKNYKKNIYCRKPKKKADFF